jgi:ubiquinone/menaquinone biosynthesis C-methylase UbiE
MPLHDKLDLANPSDADWLMEATLGNMLSHAAIMELLVKKGLIGQGEYVETLGGILGYELERGLLHHSDEDITPTTLYYHPGGEKAIEILAEMAHVSENTVALDVGCGMGVTARYLAKNFGAKVTGIDTSFQRICLAILRTRTARLDRLVSFKWGDGKALPFADASFNLVYAQAIGERTADVPLLRESWRVLGEGGLFALQERFQTERFRPEDMAGVKRQVPFGITEYKAKLAEAGFEFLDMETEKMTPLYRAYEDRTFGDPFPAHWYGDKLVGAVLVAEKVKG